MEKIDLTKIEKLADYLCLRKKTLATAESCTGGLIASHLTSIPGSSLWFDRGLVTYSNRAKMEQLSVSAAVIEKYGAVSFECAQAMLIGLLTVAGTSFGISVTGIAGPSGASDDKPVGLVWIACGSIDNYLVKDYHFEGDRNSIRIASSNKAIANLLELIKSC